MDKLLEQQVRFVEIFLELLTSLFGVFTKQRQRALVLSGGMQLNINIVPFQQAVEIGDLRDHADGANNRERCCHNTIGYAGHHVTAAGRHFIHGRRDTQTLIAQTLQLRGCQAIAMNHAARAFKTQQHFIARLLDGQHG